MAEVKGLTVDPTELSQTLDLDDLLGAPVSSDPVLARAMVQHIIDYHKLRLTKSQGLGGAKFKDSTYSKVYKSSLDFIAAGKSDPVNMQLSGDMVGSLDILSESGSKIKYGVADDEVLPRAFGHQSGFEGHPAESKLKQYKREWFGVTPPEARDLLKSKFSKELASLKPDQGESVKQEQLIKVARTFTAFVEDIDG